MRKIIIIIMLFINSFVFSNSFKTYDLELIKEYKIDNADENSLGADLGQGGPGTLIPTIFFENENLVISDDKKRRSIILDEDFEFKKIEDVNFYNYSICNKKDYLLAFHKKTSAVVFQKGHEWTKVSEINFENKLYKPRDIFYHSNILFIYDNNWKLWSIKNPTTDSDENYSNLLNDNKTLNLFKDGEIDGLTIDSKNRLFINGELQTTNYKIFYNYYKEQNPDLKYLSIGYDFEIKYNIAQTLTLIGNDMDNNTYWDIRGFLYIFNSKGLLINFIKYGRNNSDGYPAVSPDGDLYFIKSTQENAILYIITRDW